MKKACLLITVIMLFTGLFIPAAFANGTSIAECPGINMVIDGAKQNFSKVAVAVNNRTMLPLRELLVKLGVPDDSQHIIWNQLEKSVTVNIDSTKIYLGVAQSTAYVNDSPIELDASPIIYKGSTYIPARFVAQALGKKVGWDGSTASVLINSENEYNKVYEILKKVDEAGQDISKFSVNGDLTMDVTLLGKKIEESGTIDTQVDLKNYLRHDIIDLSVNNGQSDSKSTEEMYSTKSASYYKNSAMKTWQKKELTASTYDIIDKDFMDIYSSGLKASETSNPDEIILKGNISLFNLSDMLSESLGAKPNIKDVYSEMIINTKTNMITSINMDFSGDVTIYGLKANFTAKVQEAYDYSQGFDITLPDGLE